MKFPAIRPRTLDTDHPQLKRPDTGDVIDFYGACDESYGHGPSDLAEATKRSSASEETTKKETKEISSTGAHSEETPTSPRYYPLTERDRSCARHWSVELDLCIRIVWATYLSAKTASGGG